jgi:predicted SprT family Zn-dependent metalloprotease
MDKITRGISGKNIQQGELSFGRSVEKTTPKAVFTRVFRCRKKGFDYLGQVQIQQDGPKFLVEIFNENYFSHFEAGKNAVLDSLNALVLKRLMKEGGIPSGYKTLILSFLEARIYPPVEVLPAQNEERDKNGIDLQEIFERLNAEYFKNKIQAEVGWGRDSKKTNRRAFRFGSYDRANRLIRIHPRLNQQFVPLSVVELTVYHEMCHQWAPSVKHNGVWRDHHADFKNKEKEYRFYQEARIWEKQNWKKFLKPIAEKTSLVT